jgi:hypothetical protein
MAAQLSSAGQANRAPFAPRERYSVAATLGSDAALDDPRPEARLFYGTYGLLVAVAVAMVLVPGAPLIPILFLIQVVDAVLPPAADVVHGANRP